MKPSAAPIQTLVGNGGRALLMPDPPLKIGKEETADSAALNKMLESWGVTMGKDLAIDASGVGQIFGLSEEVPLATSYESHAIVGGMKESATAFPLTRTMGAKHSGSGDSRE